MAYPISSWQYFDLEKVRCRVVTNVPLALPETDLIRKYFDPSPSAGFQEPYRNGVLGQDAVLYNYRRYILHAEMDVKANIRREADTNRAAVDLFYNKNFFYIPDAVHYGHPQPDSLAFADYVRCITLRGRDWYAAKEIYRVIAAFLLAEVVEIEILAGGATARERAYDIERQTHNMDEPECLWFLETVHIRNTVLRDLKPGLRQLSDVVLTVVDGSRRYRKDHPSFPPQVRELEMDLVVEVMGKKAEAARKAKNHAEKRKREEEKDAAERGEVRSHFPCVNLHRQHEQPEEAPRGILSGPGTRPQLNTFAEQGTLPEADANWEPAQPEEHNTTGQQHESEERSEKPGPSNEPQLSLSKQDDEDEHGGPAEKPGSTVAAPPTTTLPAPGGDNERPSSA